MLLTPIRSKFLTKFLLPLLFVFVLCAVLYSVDIIRPYKHSRRYHSDIRQVYDSLEELPHFPEQNKHIPTLRRPFKQEILRKEKEAHEEWALDNENIPNLSSLLWNRTSGPTGYNGSCAKYPDLYKIRFSNVHWQVQATAAEEYFLYSAYLDTRGTLSFNGTHSYGSATVRILGMSSGFNMKMENTTMKFCQFWFEHKPAPIFDKVTLIKFIWNTKWGSRAHYFPYLFTCNLPTELTEFPVSVSLVPTQCTNATNNLGLLHRNKHPSQLTYNPSKSFGVCVKSLDLPDKKARDRLAEWIETMHILGAEKIFFYEYFVHEDIKRMLDYYEHKGIIGVSQISLPGEMPNQAQLRHLYIRGRVLDKRMTELIPYNDCLLRNMYDYKYLAVIDTDEIIMPAEQNNWLGVLEKIQANDMDERTKLRVTTICFRNYYFMDGMLNGKESQVSDISEGFHMLRHVFRSTNHTDRGYMKCFHSTKEALGVHNHFTLFCRQKKRCVRHLVNVNIAQLNHYRSTCVADIKNCSRYNQETDKDVKIWRYKDEIISRVTNALHTIES